MMDREATNRGPCPAQPVIEFLPQLLRLGILLELLCPLLERGGLRWQLNGLTRAKLPVSAFQILKQDLPGDDIHSEMVDHDQQATGSWCAQAKEGDVYQWPLSDIETSM